MSGEDPDLFYIVKNSASFDSEDYFLIMLNVVWDGAALDLHVVYRNMTDWILDTIHWVLDNTNKTVVIRQHPGERASYIRSSDDYQAIISDAFGDDARVVFISSFSNIDAYHLIESSNCVIGFSSSALVEAVTMGKPTLIVSEAYFSDLNIVYKSNNKKQYYQYLSLANTYRLPVTQEMKNNALVCNYLTQTRNRLLSGFTTDDVNSWVNLDMQSLTSVHIIVEAIEKLEPVSLICHRKSYKVYKKSGFGDDLK